ncbi:hypothetical protein QBC45DRAFT_402610 [Copromyces sp. CBS 386.78]|nr:hypothetical protein QBC45DRAFT_402610 [Copromyces sp. CBS 386.78]
MPAFIKPGRDSRHRFACKALFRALLRAGYRVPLPHDVATALDEKQNPIRALIRNGFRRNSSEISLRLVNSALNKGYRFFELLTVARDESSPAHAQVLQFLRENNERVLAIREKKRQEAEIPNRFAPKPGTVPLLTKIPNPDGKGPPTFVPTVRPLPLEKLSGGVRKLPTLDDLGGHPFLRLRKPQSEYLGRVLRQKFKRRQRWAEKYHELVTEELADAEQEDAWDEMVEEVLEGVPQPWDSPEYYATDSSGRQRWTQSKQSAKRVRKSQGSYAHAVKLSMTDLEFKQKREWDEMIERGKALWKLVLEERALAAKEKKTRKRREKVKRKREKRRAVKAERREARRLRRVAKMRESLRKWRVKTRERKKRERAERKRLKREQEARQLEEAKSEEPAAVITTAVEQESEKVETQDTASEEGRLRGSQALKATRQPKKTNVQTVPDVKDTESPAGPAEPAKEPEASPEETPVILQEPELGPEPAEVQPQEEPTPAPPAPKKRGRPRKVVSETPATEPSTEPETTAPKKIGRPRKVVAPTEEEAPKKRGGPRKVVAPPEEEAAPKTIGVSRDTFPPTAIHPTGRNQLWKRPSDRMYFSTSTRQHEVDHKVGTLVANSELPKKRGRPKKEVTGTPVADSELPKKRGRPKKITAMVSETPSAEQDYQHQPVAAPITAAAATTTAPTDITPTSTAPPTASMTPSKAAPKQPIRKKDQFSPSDAATLLAQARIQSLLVCELFKYHNYPDKTHVTCAPNPGDPLDPLATSVTTPFDRRFIRLPSKLTNKTTASAAQALGLDLDKETDVFSNGGLFRDQASARANDAEWLLGVIKPGYRLNDTAHKFVYRQRRGRYTMDLWEGFLCRWVEDHSSSQFSFAPRPWWPDPTPESQEIVIKALAQAVLDELIMCSRFKYELVMDQRDDGSTKLSSLVKIPQKVKSLLGMSMAEEWTAKESVLWGGEVMELEKALEKDYEMWRNQSEAKKERWTELERIQQDYALRAEREETRPRIIRRVWSPPHVGEVFDGSRFLTPRASLSFTTLWGKLFISAATLKRKRYHQKRKGVWLPFP